MRRIVFSRAIRDLFLYLILEETGQVEIESKIEKRRQNGRSSVEMLRASFGPEKLESDLRWELVHDGACVILISVTYLRNDMNVTALSLLQTVRDSKDGLQYWLCHMEASGYLQIMPALSG